MTAKELIAALRQHDQSVQVKVRGGSGALVTADLGVVIFPSGACLVLVPEGDISWPRGTKPRRKVAKRSAMEQTIKRMTNATPQAKGAH